MKRASYLIVIAAGLVFSGANAFGSEKFIDVNDKNFKAEVLHNKGLVFVDFYATWCGPCMQMKPVLDELAAAHSDVKFARVDTDKAERTSHQVGIMVLPTFNLYRNGKLIGTTSGLRTKEEMSDFIVKASGTKH